jgi:8-oxo-dGTP pyrophosphatase MutT (NUDIX family)
MSFEELQRVLTERLRRALPGAKAHEPMRAAPIGSVIPNFDHKVTPKPGGVLILLYEKEHRIMFPLIKRQEYLGAHSGQVSLPGGKAEEGETMIETALRETEEEIGVDRASIKVLGVLSEFFVIPSNFLITPVIGVVDSEPVFKPDPKEVARILEGSVDELLAEHAIRQKEILAAGKFRMIAPHFEIENEVVWGATAMMLNEFRSVLRDNDLSSSEH